jgi:5-methylcytosine-specific restriction endonuclease McrA
MGNFYQAVVQSVLLYASETWQVSTDILTPLTAFHHKVARYKSNKHIPKLNNTKIWVYPNMNTVLQECGL